jgi:FkbM family methyltransferase
MKPYIKKIAKKILKLIKMDLIKSDFKSSKRISFSQTGEDMIVDFIFTSRNIPNPTYIDIGAFDPYLYSNTAYFYDKFSRGINIEPNPSGIKKFNKFRPLDINLNIGISNLEGKLDYFFMNASTMNTFDENTANELVEKHGFKIVEKKEITCTTLQNVLLKYADNVFPDFLSLDVEGLDMEILNQIDYEHNYPKVICVETIVYSHDGSGVKNKELINFLEAKGYFIFADTFINTIFINNLFWQNK